MRERNHLYLLGAGPMVEFTTVYVAVHELIKRVFLVYACAGATPWVVRASVTRVMLSVA
jgi:hypothetical protein